MADATILERIRKVLKRTEAAGCTAAEAEAAFALAQRLLTEHNLAMDDVGLGEDESNTWAQEVCHETGRWSLEDRLCYGIVTEYYFVEGILKTTSNRKALVLFGRSENVATGRFVWSALRAAFSSLWREFRQATNAPTSERRLFVTGVAGGFSDKLREEREAQIIERDLSGGGGTELAIADVNRKTQVAFNQAFPHRGKNRCNFTTPNGPVSTLEAGRRAGRNLTLNRGLDGGRKAIER